MVRQPGYLDLARNGEVRLIFKGAMEESAAARQFHERLRSDAQFSPLDSVR